MLSGSGELGFALAADTPRTGSGHYCINYCTDSINNVQNSFQSVIMSFF